MSEVHYTIAVQGEMTPLTLIQRAGVLRCSGIVSIQPPVSDPVAFNTWLRTSNLHTRPELVATPWPEDPAVETLLAVKIELPAEAESNGPTHFQRSDAAARLHDFIDAADQFLNY